MFKRGEIYFVRDNKQGIGSEQRGDRPAIIVSNNANNTYSTVYEVVYMTGRPKTNLPTHFVTNSALKPSTVLCEQISSVHEDRIGEWIGTLTDEEMKMLDKCLAISIGLKITDKNQNKIAAEAIKTEEIDKLQKQVDEALDARQAAEKQAALYKEMYEFLLKKQLSAGVVV